MSVFKQPSWCEHHSCNHCMFRVQKLQGMKLCFATWKKNKKTLCYCFWASQGMSYCNPSISWNEQRRCDCLQQGNGLKTARQGKKKIYESRRELVLTRFCLSQRKQWRALSASGCCFYMSVAHKGLGKAWENVICAVYHRHSYFPSDSSENYKFNIIAL